LLRWHNDYNVGTLMRPGVDALGSTAEAIDYYSSGPGSAGVIGTPDDLIDRIREMWEVTGGFGVVMGFVNDWAEPEAVRRSWDLVARHVIPEIRGQLAPMRASNEFVQQNREVFDRAGKAILSKIRANERADGAFRSAGVGGNTPITPHHAPTGPESSSVEAEVSAAD
jgi:limonene 1,2-monooxygenase